MRSTGRDPNIVLSARLDGRATDLLRATLSLGIIEIMGATTPRRKATSTSARKTSGRSPAVRAKVVTKESVGAKRSATWRPVERTQFLVETVGGVTQLARTLGVAASQPSRWKSGEEIPSPEIASKLLDLDHVVALAVQVWDPEVVMDWMTTGNGFLEGSEPIDVLLQRGPAEVVDALKATISGAYA